MSSFDTISHQNAPIHPKPAHFASNITLSIHPSAPPASIYHPPVKIGPSLPPSIPPGSPPVPAPANVLLLLHGLGDTHIPYLSLAKSLNLPDTVCLALCAPTQTPFGGQDDGRGGFHWGDDVIWDAGNQGLDMDTGFKGAVEEVGGEVVLGGLFEECGYTSSRVVVWGMGQGGCVGMAVAAVVEGVGTTSYNMDKWTDSLETASESTRLRRSTPKPLGGIISLGGTLPAEVTTHYRTSSLSTLKQKCKTPILLVGGSDKSSLTETEVRRIQEVFGDVTVHRWKRAEDGMPKNREEMLPIMRFLARVSKSQAPPGTIEIT